MYFNLLSSLYICSTKTIGMKLGPTLRNDSKIKWKPPLSIFKEYISQFYIWQHVIYKILYLCGQQDDLKHATQLVRYNFMHDCEHETWIGRSSFPSGLNVWGFHKNLQHDIVPSIWILKVCPNYDDNKSLSLLDLMLVFTKTLSQIVWSTMSIEEKQVVPL